MHKIIEIGHPIDNFWGCAGSKKRHAATSKVSKDYRNGRLLAFTIGRNGYG